VLEGELLPDVNVKTLDMSLRTASNTSSNSEASQDGLSESPISLHLKFRTLSDCLCYDLRNITFRFFEDALELLLQ